MSERTNSTQVFIIRHGEKLGDPSNDKSGGPKPVGVSPGGNGQG
jgi:hypothetical protein